MATLHEQYAAALETLVEKTDVTTAVQKLQSLLAAKGRLALLPKIAVAFQKQAKLRQTQNQLVLFVARQSDADIAQKEAALALGGKAPDATFKVQVDETLIGGWRVEGAGILIDSSFKKHLKNIYETVINK